MQEIAGIILAFAFIFAVIGVAQFLVTRKAVTPPVARKIIHISVAHWWLIAMAFHEVLWAALVGPIVFIILNYLSYRGQVVTAMDSDESSGNLGTVYFPISLLILVLLTYGGEVPIYVGAVGILVMGYGDGLASLFGTHFGRPHTTVFRGTKSFRRKRNHVRRLLSRNTHHCQPDRSVYRLTHLGCTCDRRRGNTDRVCDPIRFG